MKKSTTLMFLLGSLVLVLMISACSDDGSLGADAQVDGWVEDGDRTIQDGDVEDADDHPPDAEIDPTWCQDPDNPLEAPGTDPNGIQIPGTGEGDFIYMSWSGTHVGFSEGEEWEGSLYPVLHLFDLELWQEVFTTQPEWQAGWFAMYGGELFWGDKRYPSNDYNQTDVFRLDVNTLMETRLTDTPEIKEFPIMANNEYLLLDIFEKEVGDRDTYVVTRSTWDSTLLAYSGVGAEGFDMSENYVSWVAHSAPMVPGRLVHFYDLDTGELSVVDDPGAEVGFGTAVHGERIVWEDYRNGNYDIYMYDISSGEVTALTDSPYDQMGPRLTGNLVVFMDYSYTRGHYGGCFCHLTILDVSTMEKRRITTNPLFWCSGGRRIIDGKLLACQWGKLQTVSFWLFDLVEMGILDSTGQHVLPE